MLAITALARIDVDAAAERAAEILAQPASPTLDLTPLVAAFLHHQKGADILAAAVGGRRPSS